MNMHCVVRSCGACGEGVAVVVGSGLEVAAWRQLAAVRRPCAANESVARCAGAAPQRQYFGDERLRCVAVQGMGAALACERAECAPVVEANNKRLGRYEDDTPTYRAFTKLWSDHRPVVVAIPTSLLLQV